MSQHPEIEARIVEELERLGLLATPDKPQPRALQYEDLSKLTYLNLVIKVRHRSSRGVGLVNSGYRFAVQCFTLKPG